MVSTLIARKTKIGSDFYETPPAALAPLFQYLRKEWTIWEPCCGGGNISAVLESQGFKVLSSDLNKGENRRDFLSRPNAMFPEEDERFKKFDCVITNPPYSKKNEFLETCYKIGKPFALLLPLTALESQERQALYKKYGMELILFDKRVAFEMDNKSKSAPWFAAAWFTNWLNIGQQMTFVELRN